MAGLTATPAGAVAQYPTRPPAAAPLRAVRFPPFAAGRLSNGVDYIIVEQHEQPVVTVTLALPAGSAYEPADRAGLAELVADLITKGTANRTADQIAAEVEGAGGSIGAFADDDFLRVTVSALSENLPAALNVLADVAARSTFPEREVDLSRTRALSALQVALSQPEAIARRIFDREVYGDHPYGRSETPATLRAVTREDVVRFYDERVKPSGALLVVAGDVDPVAAHRLAEQALASWTGAPAPAPAAAIRALARTEIVLVHKPGAVQSNVLAGFPFITPRDPALYPLTVVNRILGAGTDARLFLILREQKGWTYGAYSRFTRPRGVGAFVANTEVRTEVTDSAVGELLRQLERMRNEAPADSEITAAKNFLVGSFPLTIETPEQIAGAVANARLLGLPDDYVMRYRDRLAAVTKAQMTAAARRFLTTDRMVVVVVGDGPRILNGLQALGSPLRIVDVEGRPLTEADLTPRATGVAWVRDRIVPGTRSYRIMVQGNAFGEATQTVARLEEGGREVVRLIGSMRIATFVSQQDTIVMEAATFAPLRVRQSGTARGQPTSLTLDYAGTRVRGHARAPQQAGMRDADVDTTLAEGVLDDNQLQALLGALPLGSGGRWTITVFSGGEGVVRQMTAAVTGEESVTVPAGAFDCWRVELTGGPVTVSLYVSKASPWVIAKYELVGTPLVFELTRVGS